MVHNQYNSALLVIVFPCRQVSDSAAGSQVYLMSMNNVEDEPDITISFVAPGVPSPTVGSTRSASQDFDIEK